MNCQCGATMKRYRLINRGQDAIRDEEGSYWAILKSDILAYTSNLRMRPVHDVYMFSDESRPIPEKLTPEWRLPHRMTGLAKPRCHKNPLAALVVGE